MREQRTSWWAILRLRRAREQTDSRCCSVLRQPALFYSAATVVVNKRQQGGGRASEVNQCVN